eukprot:scaffold2001_cov79-Skeletonema_dohrnii-CCMP3373.AAC.3
MSTFAGHVRSMIYDGRLMMPSSAQLDNAGQATNYTSYSLEIRAHLQCLQRRACPNPKKGTFLDDPHGRQDAFRKRHSTVREALDVAASINAEAYDKHKR